MKFYEQINEIAKRIEQEAITDKEKELKLKELDRYVRSVTD